VLADSAFPIWDEIRPALAEAVAVKLDAAVFAGIEKPDSWPEAIIPAAIAAGNEVTAGATPAEGGALGDLEQLLDAVEAAGYDPTAFLAERTLRGLLRRSRDASGQPLLDGSTTTAWDLPIAYAVPGTLGGAIALAGDFTMAVIGIRQDLSWTLLDQAALSDTDGKIVLNLAQQDSVAIRVVARFGYATANPATLAGGNTDNGEGGFPFAVLEPATRQAAAKSSSSKAASA
jgi:HK97 family phage major capsid protein